MSPPGGATKDSTGRRIWPTARPLVQTMLKIVPEQQPRGNKAGASSKPGRMAAKTVLELGSGCGLLGMSLVTGTMPTSSSSSSNTASYFKVTMTDQSAEWLEQNLERNKATFSGGGEIEGNQDFHPNIEIHKLEWGNQQDMQSLLETSSIIISEQKKQFDYIVGSDLLYNPVSHKALVATLKFFSSLSASSSSDNSNHNVATTTILLAYPKRQSDEAQFLSLAESHGFSVQTEPLVMVDRNGSTSARAGPEYALATLIYDGA